MYFTARASVRHPAKDLEHFEWYPKRDVARDRAQYTKDRTRLHVIIGRGDVLRCHVVFKRELTFRVWQGRSWMLLRFEFPYPMPRLAIGRRRAVLDGFAGTRRTSLDCDTIKGFPRWASFGYRGGLRTINAVPQRLVLEQKPVAGMCLHSPSS
jgi:hypothetical protein